MVDGSFFGDKIVQRNRISMRALVKSISLSD